MINFAYVLSIFSSFTMLLPFVGVFVLCAATRKELLNKDIFAMANYILFSNLVQAIIFILAIAGKNNLIYFNLFMPIEFAFFVFIILINFQLFQKIVWLLAFLVIAVCYVIIGLTETYNTFPTAIVLLQNTIIIPLAFNSVIKLTKAPTSYTYRDLIFKGIIIYSLGNFIMIAFVKEYFHATIVIHTVLNTYANYAFFKSLISYRREMNGLK